ncbi:MAG: hypothetical protein V3S29_12460 [bacterium]
MERDLDRLGGPPELVQALERLLERAGPAGSGGWLPAEPLAASALVRLGYAAPFLLRYLTASPQRLQAGLLEDLQAGSALLPWANYNPPARPGGLSEAELMRRLRVWKYDNYVRITAQELLEIHSTAVTCELISRLADGMIATCYRHAFAALVGRHGLPMRSDGGPALGAVVGMGKLGGRELNYASDVDLIFVHEADDTLCRALPCGLPPPLAADAGDGAEDGAFWERWKEMGQDRAGATGSPGQAAPPVDEPVRPVGEPVRPVGGGEFHNRLARQVVRMVSGQTGEGFGFRVDLDLRPLGRSGLLSPSLAFLAQYYDVHGREWERTAMLKARRVAGAAEVYGRFHQIVRPFVFRRYLDYSAVEGIAIVKHDIDRNHRNAPGDNIKLGRGGIRENEFFIQALQLLYGGKTPDLQVSSHQQAVERLADAGILPAAEGAAHLANYWLLRKLENRLQMVEERQTHDLPAGKAARVRVFHDFGAGFEARLGEAEGTLRSAREATAQRFHELFASVGGEPFPDPQAWREAVRNHLPPGDREEALAKIDALLSRLMRTRQGERCVFKVGRLLAQEGLFHSGTEPALPKWLDLLEQIGNRNALHTLLAAHPRIVPRVSLLFAEGGRHAKLLIRHPQLLEGYLALAVRPPRGLRAAFADIVTTSQDEEEFILELRMAKSQAMLQILSGHLEAPQSREHRERLSDLAEATVAACARQAWQTLTQRHGLPAGAGGGGEPEGFAVLALGKLGSRGMHFGSDLDLAFVYGGEGTTEGGKSHQEFFTRLAQKIGTLLTSQTQFGNLYEIDHRLRPFGAKGLLVPSLNAFRRFAAEAEVWNFQAFTRLRHLCGERRLGAAVSGAIADGWRARALPHSQVAAEVWRMLSRLVREHAPRRRNGAAVLPLKYAVGGMMGFEFLGQYHFLKARLQGAPGWTPPEEHEKMHALRPAYEAIGALDERLSFHDERFRHRLEPEVFEKLPGLAKGWNVEEIGRLAAELEAGVTEFFHEQMA